MKHRERMISIKQIIDVSRKIAGLRMVLSITRSRSGQSITVSRVIPTNFPGFTRRVPLGTLPLENECVSYDALSKLLRGG